MDPHRNERRLRLAESLTLGARLGVLLLFGWGAWASQRALSEVDRTRRVMQAIEQVRLQQLATRMHNRGVLLSGDPDERSALVAAQAARDSALRGLAAVTADNPDFQLKLGALRATLDTADAIGAAMRRSAAQVSADSIRRMLQAPARSSFASVIDARLGELLRAEEARVEASTARQRQAIRLTLVATAIGIVVAAIIGITTLRFRRRNMREMTAHAATFQRLAEDNPDGVLVHIGNQVVYANAAIDAMLRTADHSLVGRTIPEIVHPEDRAIIEQRTEHVALRGTPTPPRVIRFLRDDGQVCEAEARGAPITFGGMPAIQVVLRDLSARRETERALQQSEQRFRAVLDAMNEGVVLHDGDLSIRMSNPAAERILGLTGDQLAGRTPGDPAWRTIDADGAHFPPEQHYAAVAMRTGRPASGIMGVERPSQHRVWISVNAVPLFREGLATPSGVVATFADITARLALEDQLRQSQKMEVMGRMASGVAHDFNNLLTIIRSASELLRVDARRAGVTFETLDDIESATDRAAALTAHLLTFSRRQHAAPALIDPASLVTDAMPILRRLAGDAVCIEHEAEARGEPAWIWADPVRFEQVLVNLVSNAKDAMPTGGTVRIRTDVIALQESVTHRFGTISAGRYVTLTVEDDGIGMTSDVLDHLFDPFYTTKPQGRGTGLGLSIVYGVVHEALGTITVQSEPGRGASLTVYWPRAEAPLPPKADDVVTRPATASRAPVTEAAPNGTARPPLPVMATPEVVIPPGTADAAADLILLVDDEESVRRVVAKQLEASGYAVITAESGRSAMAMLRNDAFDIRVVVSDVRMPGMTGIELVSEMAAHGIDRPVLLVSGQLDTQLPQSWPRGATVRFLPKPLSGVALRRTVSELLALTPRVRA